MPRSRASGAVKPASQWAGAYADASRQPLSILVFLLPLVVAYEIGLGLLLRSSDGVLTNTAHETLLRFFEEFGIAASGGLYLGGASIVVVLLIWHLLTRDPWRIDPATPGLMAVESLLLSLPLIVLGVVVAGRLDGAGAAGWVGATAPAGGSSDLASLGIWSGLAISIGAGLYEELLFRMLLIAVLHTLLVDVGKTGSALGAGIAVVVSAAAFTWYHPVAGLAGGLFYFLAGLYFGGVYVVRGFGIVVGAHVCYDILIVLLMRGSAGT